jgi:hypothetical protein
VADSPTAVGNCCSAICVVLLLFLLFSLSPYFLSLTIAHILRGTNNPERNFRADFVFSLEGHLRTQASRNPGFRTGAFLCTE